MKAKKKKKVKKKKKLKIKNDRKKKGKESSPIDALLLLKTSRLMCSPCFKRIADSKCFTGFILSTDNVTVPSTSVEAETYRQIAHGLNCTSMGRDRGKHQ